MASKTVIMTTTCNCHQWLGSISNVNRYFALCTYTNVSEPLLTSLLIHGLITEDVKGKVGLELSDMEKSKVLYKHLWMQTGLVDKLIQVLNETGNLAASNVLQTCLGEGSEDYGRKLYTSQAIMENYEELCSSTTVNDGLLSMLVKEETLKTSEVVEIDMENSNSEKSAKLYDLLKVKQTDLLWRLLHPLKFSGNEEAIEILLKWGAGADARENARYIRRFTVARLLSDALADDGSEAFFKNLRILRNALTLTSSDFVMLEHNLREGRSSPYSCVEAMLQLWVGRAGNTATITKLKNLLEENDLGNAGAALEELETLHPNAMMN